MQIYDAASWYWYVGGDTANAFSSAVGTFVPAADPTFAAWLAAGNTPTAIDTAANLGQVLAQALVRPTDAAVLAGYTSSQAKDIVDTPSFKVIFYLLGQVASLQGTPAPTAANAVSAMQALL